jgi:outer membrane protein
MMHAVRASALGLALTLIGGSTLAQTEAKIGFVNSQRLFAEFQGFRDAEQAYQRELDDWLRQLSTREEELRKLESDFKAQEPMLSNDRRIERQSELQRKAQEFEQFRQSVFGQGGKADKRNQELLEPVLAVVETAVEAVAKRSDYDIVFDAVDGNIIYGDKEYDITDLVLEQLRTQTGTATAPPTGGTTGGSGTQNEQ